LPAAYLQTSGVGGGGAGGESAPTKVLICRKFGQIPGNPGKNGAQRLTSFSKAKGKHTKIPFFWRSHQKGLYDLCERKFVGKSRTKTFRASLGKFGK